MCRSRLLQGVTACDVSGAGLGSHAGQSVAGLSAEAMRWMSSTASLTCVDGWTPSISPAPVSRAGSSYSLQVNIGGTGKMRDIRLECGYSAKELVDLLGYVSVFIHRIISGFGASTLRNPHLQ